MKKVSQADMQENADRLKSAHKKSIFGTEDGQYFFEKHAAVAHNKFLKQSNADWDGEIIDFENKSEAGVEVEKEPVKEAPKAPVAPKGVKGKAATKEGDKKYVLTIDEIPPHRHPNPIGNQTGTEPTK